MSSSSTRNGGRLEQQVGPASPRHAPVTAPFTTSLSLVFQDAVLGVDKAPKSRYVPPHLRGKPVADDRPPQDFSRERDYDPRDAKGTRCGSRHRIPYGTSCPSSQVSAALRVIVTGTKTTAAAVATEVAVAAAATENTIVGRRATVGAMPAETAVGSSLLKVTDGAAAVAAAMNVAAAAAMTATEVAAAAAAVEVEAVEVVPTTIGPSRCHEASDWRWTYSVAVTDPPE